MKELTGSAQIADAAINSEEMRLEHNHTTTAWFVLACAALRILANIADSMATLSELSEAVEHNSGCIVTRPMEY